MFDLQILAFIGAAILAGAVYAILLPLRKRIMAPRLREWATRNNLMLVDFKETSPLRWPKGSMVEKYWKTQALEGNVFRVTVRNQEGELRTGWLMHAKYVTGGGIEEIIWDEEGERDSSLINN